MLKTSPSANDISPTRARCTLCGRVLDVAFDPLSGNCGGDCWGCVGAIEADLGGNRGWGASTKAVREEIAHGWRDTDGRPKPQAFFKDSVPTGLSPGLREGT